MKSFVPILVGLLIAVSAHAAQARTLHIGGQSVTLTSDKRSTPALAVQIDNTVWYGYLVNGTAPGRLTMQMPGGQIHSLTAPPPTGYVTNGLILHLDAIWNTASGPNPGATIWNDLSGNGNNFEFAGPAPAFTPSGMVFNQMAQMARSVSQLQLSGYNAITIEARWQPVDTLAIAMPYELTPNWNLNPGAIGWGFNSNCGAYTTNAICTVHRTTSTHTGTRLFIANVDMNDGLSHTTADTYSSVVNPTGRLSYVDGILATFVPMSGYTFTGTDLHGGIANARLFIAHRGDTNNANWGGGIARSNLKLQSFRIYNRQLSAAEICQNAWADYNRFGGAVPGC